MSRLIKTISANKPTSSSSLTNQKSPSSSSSLIAIMRLKNNQNRRSSTTSFDHQNPLSSSKLIAEQRAKARDIVLGIQRKNIKLIAIDFDNTFLSIHTNGYYQGTVDSLLEHIRTTF